MTTALSTRGYIGGAGGTPPATPTNPTITIVSPIPPAPVLKDTVVIFEVTDPSMLREVFVYAKFEKKPWEVIHDGFEFAPQYYNPDTTRVSITNGYRYTVLRTGGWPKSPRIVIIPVNTQGNLPLP